MSEQDQREIYPGLGVMSARRNPTTGRNEVTRSGTAWINLLSLLGSARACASLEQLMEQGRR